MRRLILLLSLWGAQAFAKPEMKADFVEAKAITPSYTCQTGPFEVSFTAIEARHGQQIRLSMEAVANGASLGYKVSTSEGVAREGSYRLPSSNNTIDPCAPLSEAPAAQTSSMTVAPKPQSVGPVTVVPGPLTVTVVTPPSEAPLAKDQLVVALPQVAAGTQVTLTVWAQKPILAKSMHFSLEQIVPVDPVAYAEWEAKQLAKAEARAERAAKRYARREARQEARAIKIAMKTQEKQKKSVAVAASAQVEMAASVQVKTQKAAKKQAKLALRLEKRRIKSEKRELRLAPKREAKLIKSQERHARAEIKIERRNKKRIIRHDKREVKLELRREKRAPLKFARIERRKARHEVRVKVRIERRDRRIIKAKARQIAREPKVVIRAHKHWKRYLAKDQKLQVKIKQLDASKQSRKDWLEARRYNLFVANVNRVESTYESLLTAELKAEFKLSLVDEVIAMRPEKEAAYNLYVETRNLEKAQLNAAAALETNTRQTSAGSSTVVNGVDVETGVVVALPPQPAPLAEVLAPAPAPGATWSAGYWQWTGAQYIWIQGHWVFPGVKVNLQSTPAPAPAKPAGYPTKNY